MKRDAPIKRLYELIPTNPVTDRIKKLYRDIVALILSIHVSTSISVLIVSTVIIIIVSYNYYDGDFAENILVEAHGMLFDILVIGIFILSLNTLAERRIQKRIENQRYRDEIDDFRGWESEEAAYRNAGNLKRLQRNGYKGKINLKQCYLGGVDLQKNWDDDLLGYIKPFLAGSNLKGVNIAFADLQNANLMSATLQGAVFFEVNLRGANFFWAKLQMATLQDVNLQGANLQNAYLQDAILLNVDLRNTKNLRLNQLAVVKSLYRSQLDPELRKQVEEKYLHLLEKPVE